jgi:ATP-dependent Zn protease
MIALPKEDQFLMTKEDMFEQIVGLLGLRIDLLLVKQSYSRLRDHEG